MRRLSYLLILVLLFVNLPENCGAQQFDKEAWNKTISMQFGYPLGSNDWEYSHPTYGAGTIGTILETGAFEAKEIYQIGFGISKHFFEINNNWGIFPALITIDKTQENYEFYSVFSELNGFFYPLRRPIDKLVPVIKIGVGGIKSFGDISNSTFIFSFGGGLRTYFTKRLGASAMFTGRYLRYNEIPLTESITGDIGFASFAMAFGILYSW